MKILYLTNIPSPYRVEYFNELGKYCDLTVVFERRGSAERDKSWETVNIRSFSAVFLEGKHIGTDSSLSPNVLSYIKTGYDHIFVTNFADLTGIMAIAKLKATRRKYYLESDGGIAGSGIGFKEWIKRWIISGADRYYSTGKIHDQYYLQYGATPEKIVRYPFSSMRETDITSMDGLSTEKKLKNKKRLGIKEPKMILMVGQFIYRKGIDILLKAVRNISADIGVYIIGGIPTPEYEGFVSKEHLNNVKFLSFKSKEELGYYYDAADLFVFPTREDIWGLVVNEALAHGVPVLTTQRCLSGTELIEHNRNGYLVPINDEISVARCINEYFADTTDRIACMKYSVQVARKYTIESMVKAHIDSL